MRSSKGRLAALGLAGLFALAPAAALAAEDDSKTLFAQGRELRMANKCDQAILAFRRALELNPSGLGSLRNIAECEEKLGLYASARRSYWDLRRAVLQSNEPKYQGWDKDAEAAYRALEAKVSRLTVELRGDKLDRASILLDGKPLDPRLAGVEIERDLGLHTIEVHYGGAAPLTSKVTLAEGQRETVTIEVPSARQERRPPPPPPPPETGSSGLRIGGFVALGVGAAGLGAMVASIAIRSSALSDIEAGCPGYESASCPASLRGRYDTGVTASTLANVFGGLAIAGAGAGATLLVLSRGSAGGSGGSGAPRAAAVGIVPSWDGARVHAIVRF